MKRSFSWLLLVALQLCCTASQMELVASTSPVQSGMLVAARAPVPKRRVHFINGSRGATTPFKFRHSAILVDTPGEKNSLLDSQTAPKSYLAACVERRPAPQAPAHSS